MGRGTFPLGGLYSQSPKAGGSSVNPLCWSDQFKGFSSQRRNSPVVSRGMPVPSEVVRGLLLPDVGYWDLEKMIPQLE